jgi:hypothetical protein
MRPNIKYEEKIVNGVIECGLWLIYIVIALSCFYSGEASMKEKIQKEAVSHNLGTYRQASDGELYFFWIVNPNELTTPVIYKTEY